MTIHEVKLRYQNPKPLSPDYFAIKSSLQCHQLLMSICDQDTIQVCETFYVIYLNQANRPIFYQSISTGGITGTVVDVRLIAATALKTLATSVIISHNHPSGSLKPSKSDLEVTKRISNALKFFDINLLDHLIISPSSAYMSFADEGML